ncbi:2Fe-2S iron-sulfur cluster-binding protein [Stutzerimonas chloritidismutans]
MDRPAWVHHRRTAGADSADPFAPHPLVRSVGDDGRGPQRTGQAGHRPGVGSFRAVPEPLQDSASRPGGVGGRHGDGRHLQLRAVRKKAPLAAGQTVLEAAEEVGVPIEYACRQGYCGLCKIKLLSGEVTMDVDDGLTPLDRSSGVILACQAKASADISVDA